MISYLVALEKIAGLVAELPPLDILFLPLDQAVGHTVADDILSPESMPAFDNSSMDGFAISAAWVHGATVENPVRLKVQGMRAAGDSISSINAIPHHACEIMTGAAIPAGYDAVVRLEDVVRLENVKVSDDPLIEVRKPVPSGQFIRVRGQDFGIGSPVLSRGQCLEPHHVLALAGLGISTVPVFRPLRVALISTGKELVAHTESPRDGQLRNSTAPFLKALLQNMNVEITVHESVGDEPAQFKAILDSILSSPSKAGTAVDLILTTGGVSMGRFDFVKDEVQGLGAEILFHKVGIQPGKPLLCARFLNGPVLFGIPGNPASAFVAVRFFINALVRGWRQQRPEQPQRARLTHDAQKPLELRQFAKAVVDFSQQPAQVQVLNGQLSSLVSPFLKSNCWAVLTESQTSVTAGTWIDTYPLFPPVSS